MSLVGDIGCVCLSDMYYLKRNFLLLLATSLIAPILYLVAFGWGMGDGVSVTYGGKDYTYIAYMVPGIVSMTTLTSAFNTISNKLMIQRRFYESFDEMMLCPVSKTSIILGKSILGIIKALVCAAIMLCIGSLLAPDLRITVPLIATVIVSCTVFSMLGVAAGMLMPDIAHMNAFNSFVILPMTFLCGTVFPVEKMPEAVGWVIDVLPLTSASDCIRSAALGTDFPWISMAVLLCWAVAFYLLGRYALRGSD